MSDIATISAVLKMPPSSPPDYPVPADLFVHIGVSADASGNDRKIKVEIEYAYQSKGDPVDETVEKDLPAGSEMLEISLTRDREVQYEIGTYRPTAVITVSLDNNEIGKSAPQKTIHIAPS